MHLPALGSNIYGITDSIIENQTGLFHKVGSVDDIEKDAVAIKIKNYLKNMEKGEKKSCEIF